MTPEQLREVVAAEDAAQTWYSKAWAWMPQHKASVTVMALLAAALWVLKIVL